MGYLSKTTLLIGILFAPNFATAACKDLLKYSRELYSHLEGGQNSPGLLVGESVSGHTIMVRPSVPIEEPIFHVVVIKDLGLSAKDYQDRRDQDIDGLQAALPTPRPNRLSTAQWLRQTEGKFDETVAEWMRTYNVSATTDQIADLTKAVALMHGHAVLVREVLVNRDEVSAEVLSRLFEMLLRL